MDVLGTRHAIRQLPRFFSMLAQILSFCLDLAAIRRQSDHEKDLERLLLRQHVRILQRKQTRQLRLSSWEKRPLAILAAKFTRLSHSPRAHLDRVLIVFKPDTVLKWHRERVRRKWTFKRRRSGGRPPLAGEIQGLIVQLARENPRWGYGKLHGELLKLGHRLSRSTIRNVLQRDQVPPAPTRRRAAAVAGPHSHTHCRAGCGARRVWHEPHAARCAGATWATGGRSLIALTRLKIHT